MALNHPNFALKQWYPRQTGTWTREHPHPPTAVMYGNFRTIPWGSLWGSPLPESHRTYFGHCDSDQRGGVSNQCNDLNGFFPKMTATGCICTDQLGQTGCHDQSWASC